MRGRTGTATVTRTTAGHEVIYGPMASGKTYIAKQRITADYMDDRRPWIIDLDRMSLPEENESDECRIASTVKEARALLQNACGVYVGRFGIRRRYPAGAGARITVTIEEASEVFRDATCRQLTERLLQCAHREDVRLRVIVRNLTLESFGGSQQIRSALVSDDPVDQAMSVYDNLNPPERREVYRSMIRAMTAFGRTGDAAHLVRFTESMEGMVRLETQHPGARAAIRAASGRRLPSGPGEGVPLDEVVAELRNA